MRKLILTLAVVIFGLAFSYGQDESVMKNPHQIVFKFYPTFLLDISGASLEGGIEYRLTDKWAIQQDFGYITTFDNRYFLSAESLNGFRFRTSLRRYNWKPGIYQAITFGYKRVNRFRNENFCRENCAYYQDYAFDLITNDFSSHYLFGWKGSFWKLGVIDFNIGPGFRVFKRKRDIDLPDDASPSGFSNSNLFQITQDKLLPTVSMIMSMSIGIGK